MDINQLSKIVKKKILDNKIIQNVEIEDKTFLHKAHKSHDKNKFHILIHPKSYIHAIVKFKTGIIKFLAHDTDMKIPIFNSIYLNEKNQLNSEKINLSIFDEKFSRKLVK